MQKEKNLKFLVIRFSSIGDIVLTSPVLRVLKKHFPSAEIHFLSKVNFLSVLENNPNVDKLWAYDNNLKELIAQLTRENFTTIIDLHKNLRSFRIRSSLGVKSYSFDKLNFKKWLLSSFKIDILPKKHLVDRYFDGLKDLELTNDGLGLDFFVDEKLLSGINEKLNAINDSFIALVIGTAHETKSPPVELLKKIIESQASPIVLLGGKSEEKKAKEIMESFPNQKVIDFVGKLSINESAAVLKRASLVISPDTGLMHIAAALQKKIISIWGNTTPSLGMYPYYGDRVIANKIAEVGGLSCRPCSKIGYNACPKKHFKCMEMQSEKEIDQYIKELL